MNWKEDCVSMRNYPETFQYNDKHDVTQKVFVLIINSQKWFFLGVSVSDDNMKTGLSQNQDLCQSRFMPFHMA